MQEVGRVGKIDVCLSAKIRILKQITTDNNLDVLGNRMFVLAQR